MDAGLQIEQIRQRRSPDSRIFPALACESRAVKQIKFVLYCVFASMVAMDALASAPYFSDDFSDGDTAGVKGKARSSSLPAKEYSLNGTFVDSNGVVKPFDWQKGTITFSYRPNSLPSTPASDINRRMLTIYCSNDDSFRVGMYANAGGKPYVYFYYRDATSGPWFEASTLDAEINGETIPWRTPGVVSTWKKPANMYAWRKVTVSWNYAGPSKRFMMLAIDNDYSKVLNIDNIGKTSAEIDNKSLPPFNPMPNGCTPTKIIAGGAIDGAIDELRFFDEPLMEVDASGARLVPDVAIYRDATREDGYWQPHETLADSPGDAPAVSAVSSPYFFKTQPYEKIYPGSTPGEALPKMVINAFQNEFETSFVGLYSGQSDLGDVTASLTQLKRADGQIIDPQDLELRVVHNWWQSGRGVRVEGLPVYTPELLLFNENTPLKCLGNGSGGYSADSAGIPRPCAYGHYPSDKAVNGNTVIAGFKKNTSRQLAVTVKISTTTLPGTYSGELWLNGGAVKLPLEIVVANIVLPATNKNVVVYHESQMVASAALRDMTINSSAVTPEIYGWQLDNMRDHGVNGVVVYGLGGALKKGPNHLRMLKEKGLTKFAAVLDTEANYLNTKIDAWSLVDEFNDLGFQPFLYGVDEPDYDVPGKTGQRMKDYCAKVKAIHALGAKALTAIQKPTADALNSLELYNAYKASLNVPLDCTYEQAKLDQPVLELERKGAKGDDYFQSLLRGQQPSRNSDFYYWQMTVEEPLANRFYTGYHLELTQLGGVLPYVFQKIRYNPFDDFDLHSEDVSERFVSLDRDLNVVYPSAEGGIDTLQWEAFREGVDDGRVLQFRKQLLARLAGLPSMQAQVAQLEDALSARLAKYKHLGVYLNVRAETSNYDITAVSAATFDKDRTELREELIELSTDADGDNVPDAYDNCSSMANANQTDFDGNGTGDACEPCFTAINAAHVSNGRASCASTPIGCTAKGSLTPLGLLTASTSLRRASSAHWNKVSSCAN